MGGCGGGGRGRGKGVPDRFFGDSIDSIGLSWLRRGFLVVSSGFQRFRINLGGLLMVSGGFCHMV